jgi:hypothetical protein
VAVSFQSADVANDFGHESGGSCLTGESTPPRCVEARKEASGDPNGGLGIGLFSNHRDFEAAERTEVFHGFGGLPRKRNRWFEITDSTAGT